MPMRVHELHPSLIHAPLALLPAAAIVDLMSAAAPSRTRRLMLSSAGRRLWWAAAGSGLAAGLAGMAASQELRVEDRRARDAMFVHGIGNFTLVVAAFGVAAWRSTHRASLATGLAGAGAVVASLYTAWLGGELVYGYGAGVKALPRTAAVGVGDSPALFSREAPGRLLGDAVRGLGWLLRTARGALSGRERLRLRDLRPGSETMSEPASPSSGWTAH